MNLTHLEKNQTGSMIRGAAKGYWIGSLRGSNSLLIFIIAHVADKIGKEEVWWYYKNDSNRNGKDVASLGFTGGDNPLPYSFQQLAAGSMIVTAADGLAIQNLFTQALQNYLGGQKVLDLSCFRVGIVPIFLGNGGTPSFKIYSALQGENGGLVADEATKQGWRARMAAASNTQPNYVNTVMISPYASAWEYPLAANLAIDGEQDFSLFAGLSDSDLSEKIVTIGQPTTLCNGKNLPLKPGSPNQTPSPGGGGGTGFATNNPNATVDPTTPTGGSTPPSPDVQTNVQPPATPVQNATFETPGGSIVNDPGGTNGGGGNTVGTGTQNGGSGGFSTNPNCPPGECSDEQSMAVPLGNDQMMTIKDGKLVISKCSTGEIVYCNDVTEKVKEVEVIKTIEVPGPVTAQPCENIVKKLPPGKWYIEGVIEISGLTFVGDELEVDICKQSVTVIRDGYVDTAGAQLVTDIKSGTKTVVVNTNASSPPANQGLNNYSQTPVALTNIGNSNPTLSGKNAIVPTGVSALSADGVPRGVAAWVPFVAVPNSPGQPKGFAITARAIPYIAYIAKVRRVMPDGSVVRSEGRFTNTLTVESKGAVRAFVDIYNVKANDQLESIITLPIQF